MSHEEGFEFDIHDRKLMDDEIFNPYLTYRYKYYRHRMADIFSCVEKKLENDYIYNDNKDEKKLSFDISISIEVIDNIYKTGELINTDVFKKFYNKPVTEFGEDEIDSWIKVGIYKRNKQFSILDVKKDRISFGKNEQKKRFAFINSFIISMTNVFFMAAILIPNLDKFEEAHKEHLDENLEEILKNIILKNKNFVLINKEEKNDLFAWAWDAVSQYIVGFELGLERAAGRFARKAGWNEAEWSELLKVPDDEIDELTSYEIGIQYENKCYKILEDSGYKVSKTSPTGDKGADLICEKEGLSFAIQCKNMKRVGNKAIQEVLASMKYYNADFGVVVTSGEFTKAARELAAINGVILISTEKLADLHYISR